MPASSSRGKYLQRRGLSWYVRVRVPPALQSIIRNTHVRCALNTKDKREAERRKWAVVAQIKAEFERLRKGDAPQQRVTPSSNAREIAKQIRQLREEGDHEQADTLELVLSDHAEDIEQKKGTQAGQRWYKAATTTDPSLDELIEQWLDATNYREQTKATYRRAYRDLRAMLNLSEGESLFPNDITDSVVVRFVTDYLPAQGYSLRSTSNRTTALSSLWIFLQQRLVVPLNRNPWQGHRMAPSRTREVQGPRSRRSPEDERAFTESELVALINGTDRTKKWEVYPRVRDLLVLGLFTGARLNELASILVRDVTISKEGGQTYALLAVRDGKTEAAKRTVAVTHWAPLQVLKRRMEGKRKADAQLFEELRPGGPDGKLSWSASKDFTRYRRDCGVPDGTDFHSFRRTLLTLMEHKGVDYVAVARFVGHQVPTMMHAVYSGGASREALLKVADAARYGPEVEKALAALA